MVGWPGRRSNYCTMNVMQGGDEVAGCYDKSKKAPKERSTRHKFSGCPQRLEPLIVCNNGR